MVEAERKLVCIRGDLRGSCVGASPERSLRIIRQRVPIYQGRYARVNRHQQCVARISRRVYTGALARGRHRHNLRGPENLSKTLILNEELRLIAPFVDARNEYRDRKSTRLNS